MLIWFVSLTPVLVTRVSRVTLSYVQRDTACWLGMQNPLCIVILGNKTGKCILDLNIRVVSWKLLMDGSLPFQKKIHGEAHLDFPINCYKSHSRFIPTL